MDEFSKCLSKGRSPRNGDAGPEENHKGTGHPYRKQKVRGRALNDVTQMLDVWIDERH